MNKQLKQGYFALIGFSLFFLGQIVTQAGTTVPYSIAKQTISELGITNCGTFQQPQTKAMVAVCSPLHFVMNATFVAFGILVMLATAWVLRPLWPGEKLKKAGLIFLFFGGIEAVVTGFSPQNLMPLAHSIAGGLAIASLNIGLIFLGIAAFKKQRQLALLTLLCGSIGMLGMLLATPPYPILGLGGWQRVAGYPFVLWGIFLGSYWLSQAKRLR